MADDVEKRRLARNIKALRDKFDVTQQELADVAGVTRQAVVDWEQAKRKTIRQDDVVSAITSHFGITSEDLFSDSGMYAKLHGLTEEAIPFKPTSALVPLLGSTHMGEFADEEGCDRMVEVPSAVAAAHPGGFCVHADGECMDNRYPSDSVLFVDPDMQPFDGCAVLAESEAYQSIVRKYSRGASALMLSPDSHSGSYDDIIVRPDDPPVTLKGVVVWYQAEEDLR